MKRLMCGVLGSLLLNWPLVLLPMPSFLPWRWWILTLPCFYSECWFIPVSSFSFHFSFKLVSNCHSFPTKHFCVLSTLLSLFIPILSFCQIQVLMLTLENPPPTLETCGDLNGEEYKKNYSKTFQKMVEKCLQRDPAKRCVWRAEWAHLVTTAGNMWPAVDTVHTVMLYLI